MLDKKVLGQRIKNARSLYSEKSGVKMTQEVLAQKVGISRGYLADKEHGRGMPSLLLLEKIANVCQIDIIYFFIDDYDFYFKNRELIHILSESGLSSSDVLEAVGFIKDIKKKGIDLNKVKGLIETFTIWCKSDRNKCMMSDFKSITD